MKNLYYSFLLLTVILMPLSSCETLQEVADTVLDTEEPLTSSQIAKGLKQALEQGVGEGAQKLSAVDGYFQSPYKILLPEEAQDVVSKLQVVPGFSELEDKLTLRLNRAAELAAQKAKPIFVDAITSMTFDDAMNIVMGSDNAATQYLQGRTYEKLTAEFQPIITNSLEEVYAQQLWEEATTAYNKIPLLNDVDTKLDRHVTQKALDGLFGMVQEEEGQIRANVDRRLTDLMKRVFALQDN